MSKKLSNEDLKIFKRNRRLYIVYDWIYWKLNNLQKYIINKRDKKYEKYVEIIRKYN